MPRNDWKYCPSCKMKNDLEATACIYCGVPFEIASGGLTTTTTQMPTFTYRPTVENDGLIDQFVREIPENGMAVYRANFMYPFAIREDSDFVIGRKAEGAPEGILDLAPLEGYIMGVSKQHARIQGTGNGYQITDLGSTNGTWVNKVRLKSNQPAALPNPATVRMGRLELYFIYRLKDD